MYITEIIRFLILRPKNELVWRQLKPGNNTTCHANTNILLQHIHNIWAMLCAKFHNIF